MCVGTCKNKSKKRFRIRVFFATFLPRWGGSGSGSWGQGLGEAPEGEVTLEMLVKVSPGQAWGEQ